jgi:hypothetical protein
MSIVSLLKVCVLAAGQSKLRSLQAPVDDSKISGDLKLKPLADGTS